MSEHKKKALFLEVVGPTPVPPTSVYQGGGSLCTYV